MSNESNSSKNGESQPLGAVYARCAVYARFSSDLQRDTSTQDQFRNCRGLAARKNWNVVDADYALALQRFDEARQIINEKQARKPDNYIFPAALYALAFLGSDSKVMAEQGQWFAAKPEYENFGLALASDTEAYAGHLGKARELNKRAVDSAVRADNKEAGAIWQGSAGQREAAYGIGTEARPLAAKALK